jgi:hypothetical protein
MLLKLARSDPSVRISVERRAASFCPRPSATNRLPNWPAAPSAAASDCPSDVAEVFAKSVMILAESPKTTLTRLADSFKSEAALIGLISAEPRPATAPATAVMPIEARPSLPSAPVRPPTPLWACSAVVPRPATSRVILLIVGEAVSVAEMRIAIAISANSLPSRHHVVIRASSDGTTVPLRQGDASMGFIARLERTTAGKVAIGLTLIVVALGLAPLLAGPIAALHGLPATIDQIETMGVGAAIGRFVVRHPLVSIPVLGMGAWLLVRADRRRARLSREAAAPPAPPPG